MAEKHTFDSTEERDKFIRENWPEREAQETPGHYVNPDGSELAVFCETVTYYPPEDVTA